MLNSRLQSIVNRVDHLGFVSVKDLAEQFSVAVETIRRDLRTLEEAGYIKRSHGGVMSLMDTDAGLDFGNRQSENASAKQVIAAKALEHIKPGDVIMLDASSSSWFLAEALPHEDLTVITNSVRIVFDLVKKPAIKTLAIGGRYSEKYGAFLGALAVSQVADFRADTLFFSCTGFDEEQGAWESNELNAAIKQMMRRSSRKSILLCDKSKLGKSGLIKLCDANQIDTVITEDNSFNFGGEAPLRVEE